ncbi:adenine-specific methyltransferase EcoRI family protein [Aliarcobacter skirrowii]|uniref:Adenine-specific methyltransferase EcoRI family protein n=1 Tax=Aliarcobacter skirrowii TaxID=28200 RepID=A0AAW9DCL7_9BACT|nr:adenine-specific methyltransferase EcoRI family protein [Aliarcobacter skirrowii]MDX4069844.1 adenine-specific methyltransferase EcoRI family protein [Aliarcobacter skirrowii]
MAHEYLKKAKKAKNDEFYTQYIDIQKEVAAYIDYNPDVFRGKTILLPCDDPEWSNFTKFFAQNFELFGIKKLISTSFAIQSKGYDTTYEPTEFERNNPKYNDSKTKTNGKIFTLDHDTNIDGKIDIYDLEWNYLEGDGDFNSDEIKVLRDEADIIITNPPFSKFRDFLNWIIESKKQFLIIGNLNAISYKEVFRLIRNNVLWLGPSITSGDREFEVPEDVVDMDKFTGEIRDGKYFQKVVGVRWFTNLDHGRRHQSIPLMTEKDVIKFSSKQPFEKYDNYDAIEVSYVKQIPSDYDGIMGVPISFLDKHNPEQFQILGLSASAGYDPEIVGIEFKGKNDARPLIDRKVKYARIFIKTIR